MSLLRTSRHSTLLRASFRPSPLPLTNHRHVTNTASTTADGQSGKTKSDAQPKILSDSPPNESNAPQSVEEHNKEMDRRAGKPAEKVKDEDVEKDKVGKNFWTGHPGQGEKKK